MSHDAGGSPAQHPHERPIGQLVTDATERITRLVRDEMRLAAVELQQQGKRLGVGAGLFGAAGVLACYGGAAMTASSREDAIRRTSNVPASSSATPWKR